MTADMDRRTFIRVSGTAAGGLMVAVSFPACAEPRSSAPPAADHLVDVFLHLGEDGSALVRIPVPEIGQGIRTSLAMLVAEELDVPWEQVRVEQASTARDMGPRPYAGGSWSVTSHWLPLRQSGAAARHALLAAAADRWGVRPEKLSTHMGIVSSPDGRSLAFGALAAEAAAIAQGQAVDPAALTLKDRADFRLIGQSVPHLDTPEIVRGATTFGLDARIPGMLRATVARSPSYGGKVLEWDDSACRQIPGFRTTIRVESMGNPDRPYSGEGVAVVADTTWAALQARDQLRVDWDSGVNAHEDSDAIRNAALQALRSEAEVFREDGDVDRALSGARQRVEAEYTAPFIVHAPMEPMNCVVSAHPDRIDIWAPTQVPMNARELAARVAELEPEQVTVHVLRSGGGFGRRLSVDFVVEAVHVGRALGEPVQVVWTREDDMRHGAFRPLNAHRLIAGLGSGGELEGWFHRQAGTSRYAFRDGQVFGLSEFRAGTWPAALAGAHRLEYALIESNLPRGPLRAPGLNTYCWATECFLDEVAHASGQDPLRFRLRLLGADRELPYNEDGPFSTGRMAAVLTRAAEEAGWGNPLPAGRGRGIASGFTFGSYVAHVIEASVGLSDGRVRVHRVVSAIDCGQVVNLNGVRHQVEGAVMDGLGACLHQQIDVREGGVQQSNFHDFPLLRITEAPDVEVHTVDRGYGPSGAGEPPYPPVAPALGNAVFAASGVRIRDLPFHSDQNMALLTGPAV